MFLCVRHSEQKMPEGSWKCEKCNNINYPFRTKCNRQNCGADKPAESDKSPSPSADQNDQVCCLKCFDFVNLHLLLQQLLVFQEQLCDMMSIFKLQSVVKFSFKWILRKSFSFVSFHLKPFYYTFSVSSYLSVAIFNLQLFTVPVSTRTCLRVEKVQSCHQELLSFGVWQSVLSSSMLQQLSSHSPSQYVSSCCINWDGILVFVDCYDACVSQLSWHKGYCSFQF